jgi:translocation and assembly module TamA
LTRNGFAFARVAERRVEVDHAVHRVNVSLDIATGGRMRFGSVEVLGLTTVDESYVRRRVPWKEGDVYDASQLAELRRHLADTHLFETIHVAGAREATAFNEVPVTVTLRESKHRGVGAGVFYSSDEGPGIDVSWEHRNLRGLGDRLYLGGSVSTQEKSGAVRYRLPDFLSTDQNLISELSFSQEDTEAYNAETAALSAALERPLSHTLSIRAGPSFELLSVESPDVAKKDGTNDQEAFELFGLPMLLRYDGSDNLLDPSRGLRSALNVTPYTDAGSGLEFLVNKLTGSAYLPILGQRFAVLASRATVGSTLGASRAEIPATKRFYAGGGGSVRGYAYQMAGPLESDQDKTDEALRNDPLGGRSMLEVGTELRLRFGDRFGLVPFIDGGTVFADPVPSFTDRVFWGAGLGFRYFTAIGPLRVDVATPLERRSGVDDPVQFYLSLGQAF